MSTRDPVSLLLAVDSEGGELGDVRFHLGDESGHRLTIGLHGHHAGLGQHDFRSRLAKRRTGLFSAHEQVGGIDLGKHLPFLDQVADIYLLVDQVAGDVGVEVGLGEGIDIAWLAHRFPQTPFLGIRHHHPSRRGIRRGVRSRARLGRRSLAVKPEVPDQTDHASHER